MSGSVAIHLHEHNRHFIVFLLLPSFCSLKGSATGKQSAYVNAEVEGLSFTRNDYQRIFAVTKMQYRSSVVCIHTSYCE